MILGWRKYTATHERWYLVFSFWGMLNLLCNWIDDTLLTSNLELLVVVNGIEFLIIIFIMRQLITTNSIEKAVSLISGVGVALYIVSLFVFDHPVSPQTLYSDYGFLNALEYENANFSISILGMLFSIYVLLKIFTIPKYPVSKICFVLAIFIWATLDCINHSMARYLYIDIMQHDRFLNVYLTLKFTLFYVFTYIGLLWNR
jgi:hypothetical protein